VTSELKIVDFDQKWPDFYQKWFMLNFPVNLENHFLSKIAEWVGSKNFGLEIFELEIVDKKLDDSSSKLIRS